MKLQVDNLSVTIHHKPIISKVSLQVADGEFVGLLGPNGSGKSTLLRCIYRLIKGYTGNIYWDGVDTRQLSQKSFAQRVAVVSQFNEIAFDFSVSDVVLMGRSPHLGVFTREKEADEDVVRDALRKVDLLDFKDRSFASLSGGERQRVILARALAQCPQFLVLDEPTNHLDIKHQLSTLAIVRELGISCLAALHDLAMASHFVDRVYLMKEGVFVAHGTPAHVVTTPMIKNVYDVDSTIEPDSAGGLAITYTYPRRGATTSS